MMQMKAGMDSEKSSRSRSFMGESINNPTSIKAGEVAANGMAVKIGENNNANTNHPAVTNAVKPVLPPSETPDALST